MWDLSGIVEIAYTPREGWWAVAAEKDGGGGLGTYLLEFGFLLLLTGMSSLLLAARLKADLGDGPAPPWAMLLAFTVGLPFGLALVWAIGAKVRGSDFELAPRVVLLLVIWNLILAGRGAIIDGGFGTIPARLQEGWRWAARPAAMSPAALETPAP